MRRLLAIACCAIVLALNVQPAEAQVGFDRPGGDYLRFSVPAGDPAVCAARCERDRRCRAWSFSYPRTNAVGAVCTLKNQVPARVENACCVSGVRGAGVIAPKGAAAPKGPIAPKGGRRTEFGIDRWGGDYRSFDASPDPTGQVCARVCDAEGRCRAWTYVRPGYIGNSARCYLKERVTRPRRRPCCISGVVR